MNKYTIPSIRFLLVLLCIIPMMSGCFGMMAGMALFYVNADVVINDRNKPFGSEQPSKRIKRNQSINRIERTFISLDYSFAPGGYLGDMTALDRRQIPELVLFNPMPIKQSVTLGFGGQYTDGFERKSLLGYYAIDYYARNITDGLSKGKIEGLCWGAEWTWKRSNDAIFFQWMSGIANNRLADIDIIFPEKNEFYRISMVQLSGGYNYNLSRDYQIKFGVFFEHMTGSHPDGHVTDSLGLGAHENSVIYISPFTSITLLI